MKRILLPDGWDEVTTKKVRVKFKAKAFQSASHWVDFTSRNPKMDTGGRNHCDRCGLRWKDAAPEIMTYFVMTDKGNKVVCQTCWDQLEGKGLNQQDNQK
jgi:hypothetical protein